MITDQSNYNKTCQQQSEFGKLVEPIYSDLFRFIFSLTKNKTIADDVLQNTLIKAYICFHQLKYIDKFKSWIFTIGKMEVLGMYKKSLKKLEVPIGENISYKPAITYYSTEDIVINKETTEFMICEIKKLKNIYSEVIILHYYKALTLEEIAATLKVNANTIRTRHIRAKKLLYEKFKGLNQERQETMK